MRGKKYLFVLAALVAFWLGGANNSWAGSGLLGRPSQLVTISDCQYWASTFANFQQVLPNGSTRTFSLTTGQTFILTGIAARFTPQNELAVPPFRILVKIGGTIAFAADLADGGILGSRQVGNLAYTVLTPGIAMNIAPVIEVRHYNFYPNDPNTGTPVMGMLNITMHGFILP